jgi:uncharacterized protein (DUF1330 family)
MPAYMIACLDVTDPAGIADYAAAAPATVASHGGTYLARGGLSELMEGDVPTGRVVVVEFPSMEHARRWYSSPEYLAIRPIREACATGPLLFTEGVPETPLRRRWSVE